MQTRDRATVLGAGLVGSLWANYLAQRRFQVDVFDKLTDPRQKEIAGGRSVNLALSHRGISALKEVGIAEKVLQQAIPMRGRMMHSRTGELTFQPYFRDSSKAIYSVSRGKLNQSLVESAGKSDRIHLHFEKELESCQLEPLELSFKSGEKHSADLLFATDGAGSLFRQKLVDSKQISEDIEMQGYGYKELTIPATREGGFRMEKHALHIWPRKSFMLIALPNFNGTFTCTLFLPFEGPKSFSKLNCTSDVIAFFEDEFSDTLPLLENLPDEFLQNPTGRFGTVRSFPWRYQGKALLLGDSAHGIVPFFGQGMNCGFEDCRILNGLIDQKKDWASLFEDFQKLRKPDTDAIATMAVENFVEMRDHTGSADFLLKKSVEKILEKHFPDQYWSRYSLVTFSNVPYSLALNAGKAQDRILEELTHDLSNPNEVQLDHAKSLINRHLQALWIEIERHLK